MNGTDYIVHGYNATYVGHVMVDDLLYQVEKLAKVDTRHPGDIASCYADPKLALDLLGWRAERGLEQCVRMPGAGRALISKGMGGEGSETTKKCSRSQHSSELVKSFGKIKMDISDREIVSLIAATGLEETQREPLAVRWSRCLIQETD